MNTNKKFDDIMKEIIQEKNKSIISKYEKMAEEAENTHSSAIDENLIKEYIQFSKSCFPKEYREEYFPNTWFFDKKNELFSIAGKFSEPSIWYRHIKQNFFEARGYVLKGEMAVIDECDSDFEEACEKNEKKYQQWKMRMSNLEEQKEGR